MDKEYEIRQILLGRVVQLENGCLAAAKPGQRLLFQGMVNGWGAVRLLGITRRVRCYRVKGKFSFHLAEKLLHQMGRKVELSEAGQGLACLCQNPMASPVLMTVEQEGDRWTVTAYTGRSPMAPLHCRRLLNRFAGGLPQGAEQVEKSSAPQKPGGKKPKGRRFKREKPDQAEQPK